jgi:hypothetical protein
MLLNIDSESNIPTGYRYPEEIRFRGGCNGYGWCGRFRANFSSGPEERTEIFRHRERFPSNFVTQQ